MYDMNIQYTVQVMYFKKQHGNNISSRVFALAATTPPPQRYFSHLLYIFLAIFSPPNPQSEQLTTMHRHRRCTVVGLPSHSPFRFRYRCAGWAPPPSGRSTRTLLAPPYPPARSTPPWTPPMRNASRALLCGPPGKKRKGKKKKRKKGKGKPTDAEPNDFK